MLRRRFFIFAALAGACLALAGCTLLKIDSQMRAFDAAGYFTGVVATEDTARGPVVVVLFTAQPEPRPVFVDVVPRSPGVYRMAALKGSYSILAFEDIDRDLHLGAGEPAVIVKDGVALRMADANGPIGPEDMGYIQVPTRSAPGLVVPPVFGEAYEALLKRRAQSLGGLVSLDDAARYQRREVREGLVEPVKFMQEGRSGLFMLEPYDAARIPVIFVHGLNGSPRNWEAMIDALDPARYQPWVFFYPSGLTIGVQTLLLDHAIDAMQERYRFTKSVIVAHSVGGLVARGALNLAYREGRPPPVQHLLTLSTPWLGHDGARWAEIGITRVPASWRDMAPDSAYMEAALSVEVPPGVAHTLFFGVGGRAWYPFGNNDGAVSLSSVLAPAAQARANYVAGFDESHASILSSPEVIERVKQRLLDVEAGRVGR